MNRLITTGISQDTSRVLTIEQVKDMAKTKGFAPDSSDESSLVESVETKATPKVEPTVKAEEQPIEKTEEKPSVDSAVQKQLDEMQSHIKAFAEQNAQLQKALEASQAESKAAKEQAQEANNKAVYMSKRGELSDRLTGLKSSASKLRDTDRKLTPAGYSALFEGVDLDEITGKAIEGTDELAKVDHILDFVAQYGISADGSQVSTFSFENPLTSSDEDLEDGLTPAAKAFISKMGAK